MDEVSLKKILMQNLQKIKKDYFAYAEILSRKVDVTPTSILEQTGFAELDTSELDVN